MIYQKRKTNNVTIEISGHVWQCSVARFFRDFHTTGTINYKKNTQTHISFHNIIIYIDVTTYNKENIKLFKKKGTFE